MEGCSILPAPGGEGGGEPRYFFFTKKKNPKIFFFPPQISFFFQFSWGGKNLKYSAKKRIYLGGFLFSRLNGKNLFVLKGGTFCVALEKPVFKKIFTKFFFFQWGNITPNKEKEILVIFTFNFVIIWPFCFLKKKGKIKTNMYEGKINFPALSWGGDE